MQDVGVLVDGLSEIGGGDGQRCVQPGQGLPVRAQPAAGGLGRLIAGYGEQVGDLLTGGTRIGAERAARRTRHSSSGESPSGDVLAFA